MFKLATFIALVALVYGDGHNRVLNFPGPDNKDNYISFEPDFDDLTAFTVCAWQKPSFADSKRWWFSYAVSGQDNEIVLGERNGYYGFHIGSSSFDTSPITSPENVWTHLCFGWDSESGEATISMNGANVKTKTNFGKDKPRKKGGNLVIGQEQDKVGGSFDSSQSFLGHLYDVNMWDYHLNETEVAFLYNNGFCGFGAAAMGPIISWEDILSQVLIGDVSIINGTCTEVDDPSLGKILRFPPQSEASTKNFLQFEPNFDSDTFTAFSVCTWFFKTYGDKARYFFSYANKEGGDNSIILGEDSDGLVLYVNNKKLQAGLLLEQQRWYHLCFSWSNDTPAAIYVDGVQVATGDLKLGITKYAGGVLNIGQEQDSVGGKYDKSQAFAGSLYNLNVFTVDLSPEQVAVLYSNGTFCSMIDDDLVTSRVVSWNSLYDVIRDGDVVFDEGDDTWRHGAPNCNANFDVDAHKEECWHFEDNTIYVVEQELGYIIGGVEIAKAACFATGPCVGFSCFDYGSAETKCWLKVSDLNPQFHKKRYSYTYRC